MKAIRQGMGSKELVDRFALVVGAALLVGTAASAAPSPASKQRALRLADARIADWHGHVAELKKERASLATDSEPYRALDAHVGRLEEALGAVEAVTQRLRESDEVAATGVARRLDQQFALLKSEAASRPTH